MCKGVKRLRQITTFKKVAPNQPLKKVQAKQVAPKLNVIL